MVEVKLAQALTDLGLDGVRVCVAVSGGVDSVCLLRALHRFAEERSLTLSVAHVNHGLRGEESEGDEIFVRDLAEQLDLPFASRKVDPASFREGRTGRERPSPQEAARSLRYSALHEMAAALGAEHVATAHHLNDQVETVLLRLLRGTGPDGLVGIPRSGHGGRVVRPFLDLSREEILAWACAQSLEWREDRSNADLQYRRNSLRATWIPKLSEEFNPQLLNAVAQLAEAQRRDSVWIAEIVDSEAESRFQRRGEVLEIVRWDWEVMPDALALRLARKAMEELGQGREVTRRHLQRMVEFLRGGRTGTWIQLPGHLELRCERKFFCLRASGAEPGGVVS